MSAGFFVSFEGIEGSGKSTQLRLLQARLEAAGRRVVALREPGGTPIGDRVRGILLDPAAHGMAAETEMLLFAASRSQLVREILRPALARGDVVLCDRYLHSSLAYQGAARRLGRERVAAVNEPATGGLLPDRVLVIDVDPELAYDRARARASLDRIESEGLAFHRAVRSAFLEEAARDPQRVLVVDGRGSEAEVHGRVVAALGPMSRAGDDVGATGSPP
jgi:dTMP kinase